MPLFNPVQVPTVNPIRITLTGSYTLANPVGTFQDGQRMIWMLIQDGAGSHAVTLGGQFKIPSSATSPLPFSTASNAIDVLAAMWDTVHSKWNIVSFVPGY